MVRTLTVTLGLALSVTIAQPAWAVSVTPTDLASVGLGAQVGAMMDDFTPPPSLALAMRPPGCSSTAIQYVYTQTVFPTGPTEPSPSTRSSASAGSLVSRVGAFPMRRPRARAERAADFHIEHTGGQLVYMALPSGALGHWNAFEPITFFFASTMPPTIKSYGLFSLNQRSSFGSAQGLAPVPEPGSIALFGSGLVALYAAVRRRRSLKM